MTLTAPELAEAIPLVAAHAHRVADEHRIRALLLKGRPATDLGVRADRPSVDADVWVDPGRFADYLALLGRRGWRRKPGPPDGVGWGHAVTMIHPHWPCAIDAHRSFPGLLTDDQQSFETVWGLRQDSVVAGRVLQVPGVVPAAAITVTHAARSRVIGETGADTAVALARAASFSVEQRDQLARLVVATGSASVLERLLQAAGVEVVPEHADPARQRDWDERLDIQGQALSSWLLALRRAPWRKRPGLLVAALRPTTHDYARAGVRPGSPGATARATGHRWRRALRELVARIRRRGASGADVPRF